MMHPTVTRHTASLIHRWHCGTVSRFLFVCYGFSLRERDRVSLLDMP